MNSFFKNKKAFLIFTVPLLLIYTTVIVYPVLQTFVMSFFKWDGLNIPEYIGLENFKKVFESKDLKVSFYNGLKYSAFIAIYQIGIASIIANILNSKRLRFRKFFRTAYFIPVVLSITVVSQLWIAIYHAEFGLLNKVFESLGIDYQQSWLFENNTAIYAVAFVDAWKGMGYHLILIYAGLRAIPETYFEAAQVDGANAWKKFTKVTLPMMSETYKICLTLTLTWGFRAFEAIYIMTKGGPGNASYTMPLMVYKGIFSLNNNGFAASTAVILLLQCVVVMFVVEKIFHRKSFEV
ncbi:sugar ABC transporter permease [Vallitalea pronyensis]|uniref:Sugar ABC transporter permease n=1 Tax=Vallitalea pronyensis TaxID=1348613 RepID=A0A8J8SIH7_9FIRM|nr:sugar ABC transporter permease [Vallitalea pronyensis]QUI24611.1 sugar ABC transporter permease [Vallitalea pronyensis]